ncbi:ComEA family DNA-binding protein [Nocardioides perillae]|uniref:Competence protein ComEA n=1 Tax=Nocardioides perillae TaxID=1119534 RepID=A0A7Y9RSD5_9ACTN|nr:ComEA family DNA-binding protein [Nocardioides perillae]NYG55510.1 competence protein ComEA [Nocardioides perillae]
MRPARSRTARAHQEVVHRRLALLAAELAAAPGPAVRPDPGHEVGPDPGQEVRPEPGHAGGPDVARGTDVVSGRAAPAELPVPGLPVPVLPVPERPVPELPVPVLPVPVLPVPGRHAARRPRPAPAAALRARVAARLPLAHAASWRASERAGEPGSWRLGPTHLSVVAVVVAVALALTTWWVVRATPQQVPLPPAAPVAPLLPAAVPSVEATEVPGSAAPGTAAPGAVALAGASPAATGAGQEVVVHVAGEVRRPGLVVLPTGSRVADAVEAAGGARRGTDLTTLNLARPLVDGEQVVVGAPAGTAAGGGPLPGPGAGPGAAGGLVDLNTADQALLETLPGVGPVTATAILDWRAEHGGFTAVEELLEVDGIGDATLEDLAPLVTV